MKDPLYLPEQWVMFKEKTNAGDALCVGKIIEAICIDDDWQYRIQFQYQGKDSLLLFEKSIVRSLRDGKWVDPPLTAHL